MDEQHFCDPLLGPAGAPGPAGTDSCGFSVAHLRRALAAALTAGYTFVTCGDFAAGRRPDRPLIVLRHDVDALPVRALLMGMAEHRLGIRASYFVRVHANEYNAFGFDSITVIRRLAAMGHEIGLHAEPSDLAAATGCDPDRALVAARQMLEAVAGVPVRGVAAHNDVTPDNNLHYLTSERVATLGFGYEAYDDALGLFRTATYVTDGHYWKWRAYVDGALTEDGRCVCEHITARNPMLYVLIHPHVWYIRHFHLVATGALELAEP